MSRLSRAVFWTSIGLGTAIGMSHVVERTINRYRLVEEEDALDSDIQTKIWKKALTPLQEAMSQAIETTYAAIVQADLDDYAIQQRLVPTQYPPSRPNQVDDVWNPYRNEWSSPEQWTSDYYHTVTPDEMASDQAARRAIFARDLLT